MLDGWEIPAIESIRSLQERRIATLPVPGLAGDLQQDLGQSSLAVEITGSLHGDEVRDTFLEDVRARFDAGEPVSFVADITTATELEEVMVTVFEVAEVNDGADSFRYRIVLREYVEPPPPPGLPDDFGLDLLDEIGDLAALALDGLELPNLLAAIPDVGNPVEPLTPVLDSVADAVGSLPDGLTSLKEMLGA